MKALAGLLLAVACGAGAAPVTYDLDPDHSFVWFEVEHFGTSTIRGRIGPAVGSVELDRATGQGKVSLSVSTATVDTGIAVFNARLRQGDLLATDAEPEAYFVATQLHFDGDRLAEVRGEFTLRGIGQPLSLRAIRFACHPTGAGAQPGEVCGGDFVGEVLRSDFGMTFGLPLVSNPVRLVVAVEARRR